MLYTARTALNCTVTTSAARTLNSVQDSTNKVLEEVRNIANSVAMGEKIPSSSAVPSEIDPGREDEVTSNEQESAI